MKRVKELQTSRAKEVAIELAAIDRYRTAYILRGLMRLLYVAFTVAGTALVWKIKHSGF